MFNQIFEIMKDKILNALRTEYANLGLGEKAFDGVASFLEKTVTEEDKIAEAVKEESVRNLLKSIQGESDSLRNKAAQAAGNGAKQRFCFVNRAPERCLSETEKRRIIYERKSH